MNIAEELLERSENGESIRGLVCEKYLCYTKTKDGELFQFSDGSSLALFTANNIKDSEESNRNPNLALH